MKRDKPDEYEDGGVGVGTIVCAVITLRSYLKQDPEKLGSLSAIFGPSVTRLRALPHRYILMAARAAHLDPIS